MITFYPCKEEQTVEFSADRSCRWFFAQRWSHGAAVLWVMHNPSNGCAIHLDPTLTRVKNFSKNWGYGAFVGCNLNPHVRVDRGIVPGSTPQADRINRYWISRAAEEATAVVLAWGHLARTPRGSMSCCPLGNGSTASDTPVTGPQDTHFICGGTLSV